MASMGDFSATGRWLGARLSGAAAALFLAAAIGVDARAALYTCVDASGQKQYFTTPRGAGCEERPSYESGAESPPPAPPPAAAAPPRASSVAPSRSPSAAPSSPGKKKYPRVSAKTQTERDLARREILLRELRREQTLQEAMAHVALAAEEAGDSRRADLFGARIRRHAVNIRAIQNELARLP